MTDQSRSARSSSHRSSSTLAPGSRPSGSNPVRPRNRRLLSTVDDGNASDPDGETATLGRHNSSSASSYGLLSAFSPANSRSASPLPASRSAVGSNRAAGTANLTNFFNDSLTQSWASVQGFASSLIGDDGPSRGARSQSTTRAGSRTGTWGRNHSNSAPKKALESWGPAPPHKMPSMDDVAAGSRAEREAALKAAKRAKVLESHDGVNGGLDVAGKHKRRNSDEIVAEQPQLEEYLVYIHRVQPNDTYAGLILRYQCREDAFRKANGLWSRDSVQMRKWLTVPVDACEIRGRPCEPPSWHNNHAVDLLARTPGVDEALSSQAPHDDFFSRSANGTPAESKPADGEEKPWTHVRWVKIDTFQQPVEICRVARNAMGYFPPRRKKSIRTVSAFTTPRQSFDLSSNPPASVEGTPARRPSSLSHRPQFSGTLFSSPGRAISEGGEALPAFMRRPGGVGSMGGNARAPGPDRDYLNTWTKKHIPGLNIDNLPSMSIMGSETARFGFKPETAGLVENHVSNGQDTNPKVQQGTGLDKAAAAVETWLRGALTRNPSSNFGGLLGQSGGDGDLIELTDTGSDDGRPSGGAPSNRMGALSLGNIGSSSRSDGNGNGTVRGRTTAAGIKGDKDE
ncbi:sterol homeostasis protein [Neonectria punicea]|uniref:Sterol homeostasis protein n=1 Tax=Neonectria punicea TaxID=979145 RepID=A0ABR1H3K2_9HYPO